MLLLALLPLLILIIVSLWRGFQLGVTVGMFTSLLVYSYWSGDAVTLGAIGMHSLLLTLSIVLIILGALLLNSTLQKKGVFHSLEQGIEHIHPSRDLRFFILVMILTPLLEGVAGFGTPGTIVPVLLIALGYGPVLSVVSVLLMDSIAVGFGALGTPIIAGLQIPLELSAGTTASIALHTAVLMSLGGVITLGSMMWLYKKSEHTFSHWRGVIWLYAAFCTGVLLGAWLLPEVAAIVASMTVLCGALALHPSSIKKVNWRTLNPFIFLVIALLIQKVPSISELLETLSFNHDSLFGSHVNISFAPLLSPFFPLVIVSGFYLQGIPQKKVLISSLMPKVSKVFWVLLPTIIIAQVLLFSGTAQHVSQAEYIAQSALLFGEEWYVLLAPFIGMLGTFIAGSTTVSNLIFGPAQVAAAQASSLDMVELLTLQTAGGGFGNAICFFNIIAACTASGVRDYRKVLMMTLLPTLLAVLIIGVIG